MSTFAAVQQAAKWLEADLAFNSVYVQPGEDRGLAIAAHRYEARHLRSEWARMLTAAIESGIPAE